MNKQYQSPLGKRYASSRMSELFSDQHKFSTWRKIWLTLAEIEKELGVDISQEQLDELKDHLHTINFQKAQKYEQELQHDVMAHVHTYGDDCPKARPIIHLGATSCMITDNADLIIFKQALQVTKEKLLNCIEALSKRAHDYKDMPCLAFTHLQIAQPTTVGKRMCLWLQDLLFDFEELEHCTQRLHALGAKGATGTQASFLALFDGDHEKVEQLDRAFCKALGFERVVSVSGQTYTRKQDAHILNLLTSIATSVHKMSTDLRLLAFMHEIQEPFGAKQIGSSAMPYKRNPMRNERVCSLARYVMSLGQNPTYTAATQWFERTLDDSANRRMCIPEAFLAIDGILDLVLGIAQGLQVNEKVIQRNYKKALPFLATETILMHCVKKGGDRQTIHERLRQHSMATSALLQDGEEHNDLLERIAQDAQIPIDQKELDAMLANTNMSGRSTQQVMSFLNNTIYPLINKNKIKNPSQTVSYKTAGVDIDLGNEVVRDIKNLVASTARKGALADVGSFAGLFDLKQAGYKDPILVSGTDGVGTKLKLAQQFGKHDTIGIDLVAMCVNDILTHGAEPLYFLDYIATGKLHKDTTQEIIKGVVAGCKMAGAALIGGETAEMPGIYETGVYDVAGFAVGAVEREQMLPKTDEVKNGDILIGLTSSGLHSNGFSLVRYIIDQNNVDLHEKPPFLPTLHPELVEGRKTLFDELLIPTKIYVSAVLPFMQQGNIKAAAHITGGGLVENVARVLPRDCTVSIDWDAWQAPKIFTWLAQLGNVSEIEMHRTFNMGIGFVLVIAKEHKDTILDGLKFAGQDAFVIGSIK